MKTLAITLVALMAIASTGCGNSTTTTPMLTYVARSSSNNWAPQLFTLNPTSQAATAVSIAIPTGAENISANSSATEVAYAFDGPNGWDIFKMGTDGTAHQLTTGADAWAPVFSPDGKTIAYYSYPSSGNEGIFTMNVDGSNQTAVYAPGGGIGAYIPVFSPDGKSLAFYVVNNCCVARNEHGTSSPWSQVRKGLFNAGANGSAHSNVAPPTQGWYTMALTGTAPTLALATNYAWGPAVYSSDGTQLVYTSYDGVTYNIFSVSLSGGAQVSPTQLTTSTSADDIAPVVYQSFVLFNQIDSANSSWDIYAMPLAGGTPVLVSSVANTDEVLVDTYWGE